jgi:SNF2 family DNA or RNA helicase
MTPNEFHNKMLTLGSLNRLFPGKQNLRPFQLEGVWKWAPHRSALSGDDMGVGKTVEAIALDVVRRRVWRCDYTAQTLVVTKSSVMGSWTEHFHDWAPYLKVYELDVKNRPAFLRAMREKDEKGKPKYHVLVVHWHSLRFMSDDLKRHNWFHVIGDEIQHIKNPKAQVTRAFKGMKPYYKTGMSGTWADNKPQDGWSPLNWLWPEHFRAYNAYEAMHVKYKWHTPDDQCNDGNGHNPMMRPYKETIGVENEHLIHEVIDHAYLRRRKEEVLLELPDKIPDSRYVTLTPVQRRAYNDMRDTMLAWIGKHESEPVAAPVVIAQLQRLQQFALAHAQLEWIKKGGEDLQVVRLAEPSAKIDALMDIIDELGSKPVVVFSQFKQAIHLLHARLEREGITSGLLTGDTPMARRHQLVQDFQHGKFQVFAGTISAGGVGITLTAADTVVFLDRAWSPSQNQQAEDRLHRMGQKNAVQVIDLIARDTLDAKRIQKIQLKWSWLRQLMGDDVEGQ